MKRAVLGLVLLGVAPMSAVAADRDHRGGGGISFEGSIRVRDGHGSKTAVRHERVIQHRGTTVVVHRHEPVIVHREETVIDHHGRAVVIDRHEATVIHHDDVVVEHRHVPVHRHREVYVRTAPRDHVRRDSHRSGHH